MINHIKTFAVGLFVLLTVPIWMTFVLIYSMGDMARKLSDK